MVGRGVASLVVYLYSNPVVKGSWAPGHRFLLTIDKINPTLGYIPGNLMIVLHRANMGKAAHGIVWYSDLLTVRGCLLLRFAPQD